MTDELTEELVELRDAYSNLITILYSRHGAGGMLHILTDDGNAEDENIEWLRDHISVNCLGDPPWLHYVNLIKLENKDG